MLALLVQLLRALPEIFALIKMIQAEEKEISVKASLRDINRNLSINLKEAKTDAEYADVAKNLQSVIHNM